MNDTKPCLCPEPDLIVVFFRWTDGLQREFTPEGKAMIRDRFVLLCFDLLKFNIDLRGKTFCLNISTKMYELKIYKARVYTLFYFRV